MRNNNFFAIELRTCVYSIFIINKGDEALPAEKELRKHRCCFSGHRPEKLLFPESIVKAALARSIQTALADGFTVFISGMARGVDLWAAELVIQFRETGLPIRLICACPYRGFESRWDAPWRIQYQRILSAADLVRFICPAYRPTCFQQRNQWMVDHSSRVIAVYNGKQGGTHNTLTYAAHQGIPIIKIII